MDTGWSRMTVAFRFSPPSAGSLVPKPTYVVSAAAPSTAAIAILAGGPLGWGGVRVLSLACHSCNGTEHLRGHVLRQGVHGPCQICRHMEMGDGHVKGQSLREPFVQLLISDMSSPARLMLAGVALIEAGVRVLLLLLGVMPVGNSQS